MMKKYLAFLTLCLVASFLFALPDLLSQKGNPELYKQLSRAAIQNVKSLPSASQKQYQILLKQYPDVLMAYLLAYESNATLYVAKAENIFSNYQEISKLLDKEEMRYSPEFFLSYVAKQTVADEALTSYRQALLQDGLQAVIDTCPDDLSRFRATTLWCVSRLQFQQTSGRDQSPLDITQKSLIGRCEEMQILFVAAARTVGLPSRPATAPWWAHMDNNHAWAEVFLEGSWHYTGDMDAAWFPDQTWFSGMIDKTVLILAEGSLAAETDEILAKGKYDTLINSTRNYAKERSRTIKLQVTDSYGNSAGEVQVMPLVFNWGSLRYLAALKTDAKGFLRFSAGRGAFYLSLYSKGEKALQYIPSGSKKEVELNIKLSAADFGAESQIMEYPSNPMRWDNQPEAYRNAVNLEKQRWIDKTERFQSAISPELDSLAYAVALECRGNYPALLSFIKSQQSVNPGFWEFLLLHDPKFLWQASDAQFAALYNNYLRQLPHLSGGDEELSLLSPIVYYEDLALPAAYLKGKAQLYPPKFYVKGKNTRATVTLVMKKLAKQHRINGKKALSGLLPLDKAIKLKYLSSVQYRILACSMLRANGIPAEFSRIPDLVTVFVDGDWEYYNVVKLAWEDRTAEPGETINIVLKIEDENGIPVQASEEQLNLCRYLEGNFYPLNNRFEYTGNGLHKGLYARQDGYLQFGYRISDSETGFHLLPVKAAGSDSLFFHIVAKHYPHTWKPAEDDILALLDEELKEESSIILIGNYDQENSKRLAEKLDALGKSFIWLGYQPSAFTPENYCVYPAWQQRVAKDSQNGMRSITLIKKEGSWQMFEGLWDKLP